MDIPLDMASFLWKMLHNLLSTQERLHRLGSSPSALCKICKQATGTLRHDLIECPHNDQVGVQLLSCLQPHMPGLSAEQARVLQLECKHGSAQYHHHSCHPRIHIDSHGLY